MKNPSHPRFKVAIVGMRSPDDTDKDKDGKRFDSIPIANGLIMHGVAVEFITYYAPDHDEFVQELMAFDGVMIRFNMGQLDAGRQKRFDNAMDAISIKGKAVWSHPLLQQRMSATDAVVKIKDLNVGLPDTFAYYDAAAFDEGFKKACAFSPRIIRQNHHKPGSKPGEGVWMVWLESKRYCETFGEKVITDRDRLKLMEMNDHHVEHHTVKEFVEFCVNGPGGDAGQLWASSTGGKYLEGTESRASRYEAGKGRITDTRLLPHTIEGVVQLVMVKDECFQIIHKRQVYSGGAPECTCYKPNDPTFAEMRKHFFEELHPLIDALGVGGEPLPILWTVDFIRVENHKSPYVISEMNCSCVGIDSFSRAKGADLSAVPRDDFADGMKLVNLMGKKALEQLNEIKHNPHGFSSVGKIDHGPSKKSSFKGPPAPHKGDLGRESTPLPQRPGR